MINRKTALERRAFPENIAPSTTVHRITVDSRRRRKVLSFEEGAGAAGLSGARFIMRQTGDACARIHRALQKTALCGNLAIAWVSPPIRHRRFARGGSC